VAADPRIDILRTKIRCAEEASFTRDYLDPEKRSIANALTVELTDGTVLEEVVVEYPVGHKRRREEGWPLLEQKFRRNLARRFDEGRQHRILAASSDRRQLELMQVTDYVDLYAIGDAG
jgi:2-methylcitrate dehydratase